MAQNFRNLFLLFCLVAAPRFSMSAEVDFGGKEPSRVEVIQPNPIEASDSHSTLDVSPYALELTERPSNNGIRSLIAFAEAQTTTFKPRNLPAESEAHGVDYLTDIKIGGQWFKNIFDTGSSDIWVPNSTFKCEIIIPGINNPQPRKYCAFGKLYHPSATFQEFNDRNFFAEYGGGQQAAGPLATESMTFGNITIEKQPFGLATRANYNGDHVDSGYIGMAFRNLTTGHSGKDIFNDSSKNYQPYPPIFETLYKNHDLKPLFSVALDNPGKASTVTLGGVPRGYQSAEFAQTPIQYSIVRQGKKEIPERLFYQIFADQFVVNNKTIRLKSEKKSSSNTARKPHFIVDTGTTSCYWPRELVEAIKVAFDPPINNVDTFACTSKPPQVGVRIGEKVFLVHKDDLVRPANKKKDTCTLEIAPSGGDLNIFGVSFLKSVLAVFDIGAGKMRFAQR